jgi:hypothetical protein
MIKSFREKLQEASLQGNPGIPGEGGKPGSYLSDVEARASERNAELQRRHGREIPQFMGLVSRAKQIQRGHEAELEALAERAIRTMYGDILEEVELRIKFPKSDEIKKSMENVQPEPPEMPQLKELKDAGIISEIHKRKIANNITQGEAKNTKLMLNLPEVSQGLTQILGAEIGKEYKDLLNKITEIAGFFDWAIPMEVQKEMWERDKSGFSGSVKVQWETPEDFKSNEDLAQDILDQLMNDDEIPADETEELFDQTKPTIYAFGTDFAMLLHETVKGIYELIAANAIPEDEESSEIVITNTDSLADEIEDLRYGPEIAADLRDFINEFPEADKITNLREHVFGKMMLMEASGFLDLILRILSEEASAKKDMQEIIDEVAKEISDYELGAAGIDRNDDEDETEYKSEPSGNVEPAEDEETDYSQLAKRDLEKLIDQALDNRDFERVKELSKYLNESKQKSLFERIHKNEGYPG